MQSRILYLLLMLSLLFGSGAAFQGFSQCSSCTTTISSSSSSNMTLNGNNRVLCITGGTYSGTVNINGNNNRLCVGPGATFTGSVNMNGNNPAVDNHGTWNTSSTLTVNKGIFTNSGSVSVASVVTNSGGILRHTGSNFAVSGSMTNNGEMDMTNAVTIGGSLVVNSSVGVTFRSTVSIGGSVTANDSLSFLANVSIGGSLVNNSNGVLTVDGGIATIGGSFTNHGTAIGSSSDCGGISVAGASVNTGNYATDGSSLDICDNGSGFDSQFGSVGAGVSNCTCTPSGPLPIELMFFKAVNQGNNVKLTWSTASEVNNDYFTIERSIDGIAIEEIANVLGAGFSNSLLNYSSIDYSAISANTYYRLRQTDYNGTTTVGPWEMVKAQSAVAESAGTLKLWPNPVTENTFQIQCIDCTANTDQQLVITDAQGRTVYNQKHVSISNEQTLGVTLNNQLSPGYYLVSLTTSKGVVFHRLVLQ